MTISEDLNETSFQFLLINTSLALTFVSVAETTTNSETMKRNIGNARTAHDSIQNLRSKYLFSDSQRDTLNTNLAEAKGRL